ncbi:MAG: hypothetical protein HeimC2_20220 [Candidatus Heimdallarchaeota archaeon LC_2]|nr:MAG: hypothetical protein HeimC2_20220 [Candidatus Heimdallarchaeota archaeon LC_2]
MTGGRPPFIRNISHVGTIKAKVPFIISLKADWPTPSWEHMDTIVSIDNEKKEVNVSYLGLRRPGVALQVIKSFNVDLEVTLKEKGEWAIIIKSRSENWESNIIVN